MTRTEFLARIRERENLSRAVLNRIDVDRSTRTCEFTLVTDRSYTPEDEAFAEKAVREAVPDSLKVSVKIRKLVADPELVRHKITDYLSRNHRAAAAFVTESDIEVREEGDTVKFIFGVDEEERSFFETREIIPGVVAMLKNNFCNKFEGALEYKNKGEISRKATTRRRMNRSITAPRVRSKYGISKRSTLRTCPRSRPT